MLTLLSFMLVWNLWATTLVDYLERSFSYSGAFVRDNLPDESKLFSPTRANQCSKQMYATGVKRGKTRVSKPGLVLVLLLIGGDRDASFF